MANSGPSSTQSDMERFVSGDFAHFGLPVPSSTPSAAEVKQEARERSKDVLFHWNRLRQILERHELVIQKRWAKKTRSKRMITLTAAWPNMSSMHRPDYEALIKEGPNLKTQKTKFREAYMWPYVNVEDLVKGKSLLLFMNSRGRHSPQMFAHADLEAMRVGHISGAVMPAFLNLHTMFLEGEHVETYGRLVAWDDDDDAMDKMISGLQHNPGEGLLILEIQQRILGFLVECCQLIMHDIMSDAIIGDFSIQPEPPALADSSEWPVLATIAAEAPYRVPARLDFKRLVAVVDSQRSRAEDHIRSLREDPGYFADVLGDWSDHRQEKMLDTNKMPHPISNKPLFWDRVIGNIITDAYGELVMWSVVGVQLVGLASLQEKYSSIITPQQGLPPGYLKALLTLRYTLEQAQKVPISNLKMGVPASPPLRSLFVREPAVPGSTRIGVRSKSGQDRLLWLFSGLWNDDQLFLHGFPTLMDEIENLTQNNPKEKAKLSSWVARVFSELGVISRIRHELDIYQPWAAGFDYEYTNHKTEIENEFKKLFSALSKLMENSTGITFSAHGDPSGGRFYYPSDRRRTQQTVQSMRKAEQNLDFFWKMVDNDYRKNAGLTLDAAFEYFFQEIHEFERTPEWTEPKKETLPGAQDEAQDLLSKIQLVPMESPPSFVPKLAKFKSKTRGSTTFDVKEPEQILAAQPKEDVQPKFALNSRAFKVFKVLFFQPSEPNLPGEISWADFLYALAATGFAPEKLYGSIWQFTPTTLDVERSIQFHEPHPVKAIPFRNARRMGRRLGRVYGWHGGMFALK